MILSPRIRKQKCRVFITASLPSSYHENIGFESHRLAVIERSIIQHRATTLFTPTRHNRHFAFAIEPPFISDAGFDIRQSMTLISPISALCDGPPRSTCFYIAAARPADDCFMLIIDYSAPPPSCQRWPKKHGRCSLAALSPRRFSHAHIAMPLSTTLYFIYRRRAFSLRYYF